MKALAGVVHGTSAADTLTGTANNDIFYGYAGNDSISGAAGNDVLEGGEGNDVLIDNTSGNDSLYGGDGDDTITSVFGSDLVVGGAGNDTILYNGATPTIVSRFEGGAGDDIFDWTSYTSGYASTNMSFTFAGGPGNDSFVLCGEHDTFEYNRGDGSDLIHDLIGGAGTDKIVFGAGIEPSDLKTTNNGTDILIDILDPANPAATDRITVKNAYTLTRAEIETYQFADGSTLTAAQMKVLATSLHGTSSSDSLTGTALNELIHGYEGNDTLTGASGNDTYHYRLEDGQDIVNNTTAGTSDVDTLKFTTGVTLEQLFFDQGGNDLVIQFLDSSDKVTVQNAFSAAQNQMDAIHVGNQVLNGSQIPDLITALEAFTPPPESNGVFTPQQRLDIVGVIDSYFTPV
jgi:Ca2+-binding RTX toxin-like protein